MSDTSRKNGLSLSIGEFAYAIGFHQSEEAALAVVQRELDIPTEEEAEIIIEASSHSLLARHLIMDDEADEDAYKLAPRLEKMMQMIAEARWTAFCSSLAHDGPRFRSYHFSESGVVKHLVRERVVHDLEILPDVESVIEEVADLYIAPETTAPSFPPIVLHQTLTDELLFTDDAAFVREGLRQSNAPEEARSALATDLLNSKVRGGIVKIEHPQEAEPTSEHRLSLVRGAKRLWLLQPFLSGTESFVEFSLGSKSKLSKLFLNMAQASS